MQIESLLPPRDTIALDIQHKSATSLFDFPDMEFSAEISTDLENKMGRAGLIHKRGHKIVSYLDSDYVTDITQTQQRDLSCPRPMQTEHSTQYMPLVECIVTCDPYIACTNSSVFTTPYSDYNASPIGR